jgi:hypothetical protein
MHCRKPGPDRGRVVWDQSGTLVSKTRCLGKVRPGYVTFTRGRLAGSTISNPPTIRILAEKRLTNFALDLGGGLEIIATRNVSFRMGSGDNAIYYRRQQASATLGPLTMTEIVPRHTSHNYQFASGVSFRF